MRRIIQFILAAALWASVASAQVLPPVPAGGSMSATNDTVTAAPQNAPTILIQLTGTWTGTVTFRGTASGGATPTYVDILGTSVTTGSTTTTATANGAFLFNNAYDGIRTVFTTATSGTVLVSIKPGFATSATTGGGGTIAATIADGADVTLGTTTDTAVTGDANGTVEGHLRYLTKYTADIWDTTNHFVKVTGGKTNNAVVPGALNLGVLNGIANASTPTWTETFQVGASYDLHGSSRVTLLDSTGAAITPSTDATTNTTALTTGPQVMGVGSAAAPTAVGADGRSVAPWLTLNGASMNAPAPGTLASGAITTAMTGTTSTVFGGGLAATASNYIYVTSCVTSNGSLTVSTDILLQDGSGGTTLAVLPAPAAAIATTGGGGGSFTFPIPIKVTTSGNALYAANVTTGSSTKISCAGYKSTVSY